MRQTVRPFRGGRVTVSQNVLEFGLKRCEKGVPVSQDSATVMICSSQ